LRVPLQHRPVASAPQAQDAPRLHRAEARLHEALPADQTLRQKQLRLLDLPGGVLDRERRPLHLARHRVPSLQLVHDICEGLR
jgi:hypothetical protein